MIESIPYDDIEMRKGHPDCYLSELDDKLKTPDDSDIGYFVELDLKYPDQIKEETKNFLFPPENKISPHDKFNKHTKKQNVIIVQNIKKMFVIALIEKSI